jgi:hypothetical protein|tara:strand:- start:235 stop:564 length:330 start_codon:yes stop_codon:yes gene_type:complete
VERHRTEAMQNHIVASLNDVTSCELSYVDIFYNKFTVRLTTEGKNRCSKLYDKWEFPLESDILTSGQLLDLMRKMTYPYYISRSNLILFSEEDAFMVKLAGMDTWLLGK